MRPDSNAVFTVFTWDKFKKVVALFSIPLRISCWWLKRKPLITFPEANSGARGKMNFDKSMG